MTILVTGGLGFIGSNFIQKWNNVKDEKVICIDNNRLNNFSKRKNWIKKNCIFYPISIGKSAEIKKKLISF